MKENENLLMSPLWVLNNKGVNLHLDLKVAEQFKDIHGLEKRKLIYNSLEWAEGNSGYKFEGIFRRMPSVISVNFSNETIYEYLMNFKSFMENEEFGLLTDDRPTNRPWERDE